MERAMIDHYDLCAAAPGLSLILTPHDPRFVRASKQWAMAEQAILLFEGFRAEGLGLPRRSIQEIRQACIDRDPMWAARIEYEKKVTAERRARSEALRADLSAALAQRGVPKDVPATRPYARKR